MKNDEMTGCAITPLVPADVARRLPTPKDTRNDEDPVALWHLVSNVSDFEYFIVAYDTTTGIADGFRSGYNPSRKPFDVKGYDKLNDELSMQVIGYDADFAPTRLNGLGVCPAN